MTELPQRGLVLYRRRPARVKESSAGRVEIETGPDRVRRVRAKDVVLLHPGPCSLGKLDAPEVVEDVEAVRELLHAEGPCDLATVSELLFGEATPAAVWATWQLVEEALHFEGTPDAVRARSASAVAEERARRAGAEAEARAWAAFVERIRSGRWDAGDEGFLRQVEDLALGRRSGCRLLRTVGRAETPESAHALLLQIGRWTLADVPYAVRAALPEVPPAGILTAAFSGAREDLTYLAAFAVDDEGSRDPDDAVAFDEDGAVWVHVADAGALVPPGSPADLEARGRGAPLYLPVGPVPMLPPAAVARLGLGLGRHGVGPALSFRLEVGEHGSLTSCRVVASTVRVERLTYAQADPLLETSHPLARIAEVTDRTRARRLAAGAVDLEWPEVRIRVQLGEDGPRIELQPLRSSRIRRVVAEAMILVGEGVARTAIDAGIPVPFSVQEAASDDGEAPPRSGLAAAFALRRRQQPARVSGDPAPHRGLGLGAYARATSPLRRYLDLLVHQQLRAWLAGTAPLDPPALMERATGSEAAAAVVRATERQANRHWTLVWLAQRPGWRGRGELIDARGRRGLLLIPELSLETSVSLPPGGLPGSAYEVTVLGVDLPRLDLHVVLTPAA